MILLLVDIGNTNICYSLNEGSEWTEIQRIKTHSEGWYLELKESLNNIKFDDAVVSSVVPAYTQAVCDCIQNITNKTPLLITHDIKSNIVRESIPEELGSDLLCNAICAHDMYPSEYVTVADFGTAFTTTTVSPKGEITGVTICPGLLTSLKALFQNTSQIPEIRLELPETILGLDTIASVRAGVIFGFVGQLKEIVSRVEKEIGKKVKLLATGGFSVYIAPYVENVECVDVKITIKGAKKAYELNR